MSKTMQVRVLPGRAHLGPNGDMVGPGGTYAIKESSARELATKGLVEIVGEHSPEVLANTAAAVEPKAPVGDDVWGLKMTPVVYLERFPEGPKAELAERMIEAGRGEEIAGSESTAG